MYQRKRMGLQIESEDFFANLMVYLPCR